MDEHAASGPPVGPVGGAAAPGPVVGQQAADAELANGATPARAALARAPTGAPRARGHRVLAAVVGGGQRPEQSGGGAQGGVVAVVDQRAHDGGGERVELARALETIPPVAALGGDGEAKELGAVALQRACAHAGARLAAWAAASEGGGDVLGRGVDVVEPALCALEGAPEERAQDRGGGVGSGLVTATGEGVNDVGADDYRRAIVACVLTRARVRAYCGGG